MMSTRAKSRIGQAAIVLAALVLGACSTSKRTSETSTPDVTTAGQASTTTRPAPTTTVEPTTTTAAAGPLWPLTGLPADDEASLARPALVVKIDNHALARPQSGLNAADIVFEENVEHLTRFAAVFQSAQASPVGPIRSGRTQDIDLLGSFNRPLFAWSGGNQRVTAAIRASDLRQLSSQQQSGFFRSDSRPAPHDLYSSTDALFALAPAEAGPPPPQFEYRLATSAPAGDQVGGVDIAMDGVAVRWTWDAASSTFVRTSDGKVHKDANVDLQVSTHNVVVLYLQYRPSPADAGSPEAQTIGSGQAFVFSAGRAVSGTWTRTDRLQPFTLTDAAGHIIELTPGRTFVELARTDTATAIPA